MAVWRSDIWKASLYPVWRRGASEPKVGAPFDRFLCTGDRMVELRNPSRIELGRPHVRLAVAEVRSHAMDSRNRPRPSETPRVTYEVDDN